MMKMFSAVATALALVPLVAGHGNMVYPPAWWDANGTGRQKPPSRLMVLEIRKINCSALHGHTTVAHRRTDAHETVPCSAVTVAPGASCSPGCGMATGGKIVEGCQSFCMWFSDYTLLDDGRSKARGEEAAAG